MDRLEWGEAIGDNHQVVDDLRWMLFQAERSIHLMKQDRESRDRELVWINEQRVKDAKIAIAALWSAGG